MPFPNLPPAGLAAKRLLPFLVALGVFGVMGVALQGKVQQVNQLRQQLEVSQQRATQLETQNQELMQQIGTLQAERKELNERIASLRTQLSSASADLERSRASLKEFQDHYEQLSGQLSEERSQSRDQLSRLTTERDTARQRVQHLEETEADLGRSVRRWRERFLLLDRDYKKLSEQLAVASEAPQPGLNIVSSVGPETAPARAAGGETLPSSIPGAVELPPIIVRKDQAGMASTVRGRILEVNGPHNFIVVDKGSMDGVRIGMTFDILRGANAVGRATVVRVRPQISACDVVRTQTPGPLQVGDLAVQSSP
ncbi:MAG: hypothetical protein HYZ91_03195 [Candidatus Omnitrophica bacterium]|nr:hypothetical protein [Candidatus Omnitrophota bacterium]